VGYDVAADLYPFFPNAADLLSAAHVPVRIGYTSGGGGPLFTHRVDWLDTDAHTAEQHVALLARWLPSLATGQPLAYDLPPLSADENARGSGLLTSLGIESGRYVVLHPGTGDRRKAWPTASWRELVEQLDPAIGAIVCSGQGSADAATIAAIGRDNPRVVSACDKTTWHSLRYLIAKARAVIGGDSVAVHIAAAEGVPCVAIMAAMSNPAHWRPLGANVAALTEAVPCAPCFTSAGCEPMTCVRGVTVERVRAAVERLTTMAGG
jgi:ADP-heptose:LPS heptosyltransferase